MMFNVEINYLDEKENKIAECRINYQVEHNKKYKEQLKKELNYILKNYDDIKSISFYI